MGEKQIRHLSTDEVTSLRRLCELHVAEGLVSEQQTRAELRKDNRDIAVKEPGNGGGEGCGWCGEEHGPYHAVEVS